ncbi:pantoate--beta-alanine ligase [Psychromonas sp. SR45-3]|uniref:pantoate--beta-alanine ligase n=1 Tax=Psychromonas sp. SR45-3 TaxID=2760930 RepID=UPI0015F9224C|nr:pantoate--beta-alanine ligase [Psychromonas sp. SR45-3]MBB1272579.1 pantoate--beta-alanine ligase [Psychromonas sp. SR45-3]
MQIIKDPTLLRNEIKKMKQQGAQIGFVPTMGNLHQGHLTLVKEAQQHANVTVVSIFVNPMQFNNANDLANYPKTLDADCAKLEQAGVDIVFIPSAQAIYPNGLNSQTVVEVPGISDCLEGELRPGHFRGVSTIVAKLFNLVQPDVACFGEKDFQQLCVIKQMVIDLAMPIEIIAVATVRETSGLAMSSRNNKLSVDQKIIAPKISEVMHDLGQKVQVTPENSKQLIEDASLSLNKVGFKTDKIHVVDPLTLAPLNSDSKQAVVLMAAFLGETRLIDNLVVNLHQ